MKNKKLTYEQQQKKQKIVSRVKLGFCIAGWCCLGLAFFGLIGLQVKSCSVKKKTNNDNVSTIITTPVRSSEVRRDITNNFNVEYTFYDNVIPFNYDDLDHFYDDGTYTTLSNKFYNVDDATYYDIGAEVNHVSAPLFTRYTVEFTLNGNNVFWAYCYSNGSNELLANELDGVTFKTDLTLYTGLDDLVFNNGDLENTADLWGLLLGCNSTAKSGTFQRFDFQAQINRYAPFGSNNDSAILTGNTYLNSQDKITPIVFTGLFTDLNGVWYKEIQIYYGQAEGLRYIDSNGNAHNYNGDGTYFMSMFYITLDGSSVSVNLPRYVTVAGNTAYTNKSYWVSSVYKTINIYGVGHTINDYDLNGLSNKTGLEVLDSFNSQNDSGTVDGGSGGGSTSTGLTDVFELLALAFTSITSIMSIQIVGSVTVGTLVFVPFVVMILIFVVWLFKR